jgi:two-component system chemotaxis response regulator CheY
MLKVAVLDGNSIARNLLTTVLANGGYHIVGGANTSSAGIASMVKLQPQIVCIDVGQEKEPMACIDTLHNQLPKALIFMVSGKIDSDTIQQALQHGVHGFIVKPFNADTVLSTIRSAVIKLAKQHQANS